MFAKQTFLSASLCVWLVGSSASADPKPDPPASGEVHPPTGTFSVGAGFSTDENFIATARVEQTDLFGTGTELSLSARISALRQTFITRFVDPAVLGSGWTFSAELYNDRHQLPSLVREATGITGGFSHSLGTHTKGFIGYRLEHVDAIDTWPTSARGQAFPLGGGVTSALRGGVEWSTVDPIESRGARVAGSLEIADRRLGSDWNLVTFHGIAQSNVPIGPLVLHLTGAADAVTPGAPRSERLYLDGSNDVRGYAPGQIAPLGGDLKLLGRAELEVPLSRTHGISLFGFYDSAAIIADGHAEQGLSTGIGILWRSPIGTLKFSWAFPLEGGKPGFVFGF